MGFAYHAKAAAIVPDTVPEFWPPTWPYPYPPTGGPDDPGITWPPGWPLPRTGYTITLSCDTTVTVGSPIAFTLTTLESGLDTSDLNLHLVALEALLDGAPLQLKKDSGDSYADYVWYEVGNYSGSSYGVSASVYLDLAAEDDGKTVTLVATLVTITPNLTAADTATVASHETVVLDCRFVKGWLSIESPYGTVSSQDNNSTPYAGQRKSGATYYRYRTVLEFYAASDEWSSTPATSTLSIYLQTINTAGSMTALNAYVKTSDSSPLSFDWADPGESVGSIAVGDIVLGNNTMTIDPSKFVKGKYNYLTLASTREVASTAPTATETVRPSATKTYYVLTVNT